MRHFPFPIRPVAAAVLAVAVLGASGCHWFRKGNDLYAKSPESRPLEVPPDLNQPDTSSAVKLPPAGTQSVTRSSMAAPAPFAASSTSFTVPGDRDAVFARLGDALATIEGVSIASKAQILGTYDVDYAGSKFLLRVTEVPAGANVSAIDPRGLAATGEAPAKLIATLKAALVK